MIKSRIMETMLAYMVNTMASDFKNVKDMMSDAITRRKRKWYNNINSYRIELGLAWENLKE